MSTSKRPYKKTETLASDGVDTETVEEHESFGMIRANRVQGGMHLFGSAIDQHGSFIEITIQRAEVRHRLAMDWYHGTGEELVRVRLSAAQFAEMITSFNLGDGACCTIEHVLGERMEPVPREAKVEGEKIRDGFEKSLRGLTAFLKKRQAEAKALLAKKSLSAEDKRQLLWAFDKALMEIDQNAPFVLSQFQEAAEKVQVAVKSEIEASVALFLNRLGLDAARKQIASGETPLPKALVTGSTKE